MSDLYQLAVKFHEPVVYLVLVLSLMLLRQTVTIERRVACLGTKLDLLLRGHQVVSKPRTKWTE